MEEQVKARVYIYGDVQGVFFRRSAKIKAEEIGVVGWVKNSDGGGVDLVCQGLKQQVNKFIAWCKKGPPLARVEKVEVEWRKKLDKLGSFEVK
jgi:acylphosphatase